ncbi:restriction endonuclease subunit S [Vibrio sp. TRT 2004]|uniref:restriction endonuclease subunit S n=1 Tax=Vibrio sp. TRT 2004 TaxID=3418506 RepID=UPI003CF9EC37
MIKLGCNTSLPSGWQWAEAGKVIDIRDGTHDSPKPVEDGIPLVTSKNLKNGKIDFSTCTNISAEDHEQISKRSAVDDGDILYAMIGTIGNPVIVQGDRDFSIKNVALFKFSKSQVFNRYFYHLLGSSLVTQQFEKNARGGTQKFVSLGNIRALQIPLPPLEEQKRIAAILDKADAIRQKRKQAIDLADEFLRSVFLDMFGDPVTNPKGWEVRPLGEVLRIRRGASPRPIKDYLGGNVPWIKIGDGSKGDQIYLHETKEFVTEAGAQKSVYLDEGALIFANCGVSLGFARILKKPGCIHDGWLAFDNIDNDFNKIFLLKWLNQLTKHFRRIAPDGTQPNLNTAIMKEQELICPPIELQLNFESVVHRTDTLLGKLKQSYEYDNEFFNSLSQKAFSGQL